MTLSMTREVGHSIGNEGHCSVSARIWGSDEALPSGRALAWKRASAMGSAWSTSAMVMGVRNAKPTAGAFYARPIMS